MTENKEQTNKKSTSLKKRLLRVGIGLMVGGLLGYAYYYFIGCNQGTCPITSNPFTTVGYGALAGILIAYK